MKRTFLFALAVAVISLMSLGVNNSDAKPGPKGKGPTVKSSPKSIHVNFYGHGHRGWREYCYYPSYGCYLFSDPITGQWYFWCDRLGQFLPISYLASYSPTTNGAAMLPPGTIPQTQLAAPMDSGAPTLPPGATLIPNNQTPPNGPTTP